MRTRTRLIKAAVDLLQQQGLRDLSIAEIARAAGASSATFYVYFGGVPDVLLAALEETSQSSPDILDLARSDRHGMERVRALVERYCVHWAEFDTIYRCRNLAGEEGDVRFIDARARSVGPLIDVFTTRIERAQATGLVPAHLDARASASTITILLERLAAVGPTFSGPARTRFEHLKDSAAYMIALMLGIAASTDTARGS